MSIYSSDIKQMSALENALDGLWLRSKVIANNIANVDTPQFKASKVTFEESLKAALENKSLQGRITEEKHIPIGTVSVADVKPQIVQINGTSMRPDGNNVDIDSQMSELAKTTITYNAVIQKLTKEFQMLRSVINGGK